MNGSGRGGKIRTHSMRFWRPPFYHWNYTPTEHFCIILIIKKIKSFFLLILICWMVFKQKLPVLLKNGTYFRIVL